MTIKNKKHLGLVIAAMLLCPRPSSAQKAPKTTDACQADVESLCKGVEKGNKLSDCLDSHAADLSGPCKKDRKSGKTPAEKIQMLQMFCKDDTAKFCPNTKPDRVAACLKSHKTELSDACKKVAIPADNPRPKKAPAAAPAKP